MKNAEESNLLRKKLKQTSLKEQIEKAKGRETYLDKITLTNNDNPSFRYFKLKTDLLLNGVNKKEELFKNSLKSETNNSISRDINAAVKKFLFTPSKDISESFKIKYNNLVKGFSSNQENNESTSSSNFNNFNQGITKVKPQYGSNGDLNSTKIKYKKDQLMKILNRSSQTQNKKFNSLCSTQENSVLNKFIELDENTFTKNIVLKPSKHFNVKLKKKTFLIPKEKKVEEISLHTQTNKKVVSLIQRMLDI